LLAGYHREGRHRVARGRGGDRAAGARAGRAARAPGGPHGHRVRAAPRVVLPAAIPALEARSRIDGEPHRGRRADRAGCRLAHTALLRPAEHAELVAPPVGLGALVVLLGGSGLLIGASLRGAGPNIPPE